MLDVFQEADAAMKRYQEVHRSSPQCELYVVHTDREMLDITEVDWLGFRRSVLGMSDAFDELPPDSSSSTTRRTWT